MPLEINDPLMFQLASPASAMLLDIQVCPVAAERVMSPLPRLKVFRINRKSVLVEMRSESTVWSPPKNRTVDPLPKFPANAATSVAVGTLFVSQFVELDHKLSPAPPSQVTMDALARLEMQPKIANCRRVFAQNGETLW